MAGEISFGAFRHALATPCDEHILRKPGIGIPDFDKGKLHFPLRKFVDEIEQFTIFEIIY